MGLRGAFLLGCCLWLAACGGGADPRQGLPTFVVPEVGAQRDWMLQNFPLLNESEEMAPPIDPETGTSPFGALVYMPASGEGTFCSVSHIAPGKVLTNAHCLKKGSQPHDYFIVFYNKRQWKRFERVESFEFVGSASNLDVAVLRLDPRVGQHWDLVPGKPVRSSAEIGSTEPVVHAVTVWAFNPLEGNHPELHAKYGGPGMRFMPKHCNASRTRPRLRGVRLDENGELLQRIPIIHSPSQERMHWFVDACDVDPVKGNSGSLITARGAISRPHGTYHWVVPAAQGDSTEYDYLEYVANDGEVLQLSPGEITPQRILFGVGSDLRYLLRVRPGLF